MLVEGVDSWRRSDGGGKGGKDGGDEGGGGGGAGGCDGGGGGGKGGGGAGESLSVVGAPQLSPIASRGLLMLIY